MFVASDKHTNEATSVKKSFLIHNSSGSSSISKIKKVVSTSDITTATTAPHCCQKIQQHPHKCNLINSASATNSFL